MIEYIKKESLIPLVQKNCLDIAKEVDRICRKHNIHYSLCGGSVIGAHLFHGFIPWDDDIDLMMPRIDYNRFLDIFPKEANERYNLLNYKLQKIAEIPTLFSRVEDMYTEVDEDIAGHKRTGHVFVDITVMDNVTNKFMHRCAFWFGSYAYMHLYKWNGMTPGTLWKKFLFETFCRTKNDKVFTLKLYEMFERYCIYDYNIRTSYCAELMSAAYSNHLYDRTLFDEYIDVVFQDTKLMVIKRYMDYLYTRYHKREFTKEVPINQRFNSHILALRILS